MVANLTPTLFIDDNPIRVIDGLYSLNDLHKASGALKKHQPANFMRLDSTQELIFEINQDSYTHSNPNLSSSDMRSLNKAFITILGKGKEQGVYVCKELVYAYAMWISAKFNLLVIRTFDGLITPISNTPHQQYISELETRLQRMENLMQVRNHNEVHPDAVDNDSLKQAMLSYRKNWRLIYDLVNKGLTPVEIGFKLELESSGIRRQIRQMRACGTLPPDPRKEAIKLEKELISKNKTIE